MKTFIILLFAFNLLAVISCEMQCKDESGQVVDWYVVYKMPTVKGGDPPLDTGLHYAYITSESKSGWTLSDLKISDEESIFGQTLKTLYAKKVAADVSYINYNDQPPNKTATSSGAHAKGVIGVDKSQGFWLIHSVPKFASDEDDHKYVYPSSGSVNGQTALCISFKMSQMDTILNQLLYMRPNVYTIKVSDDLKSKSTNIGALQTKDWSAGQMSVKSIQSTGGVNFTSFSKSPGDHVDLYAGIVAPALNTNLYVQSWRKGAGGPLPSECDLKRTVENVHDLSVSFDNSKLTGDFDYLIDHSKWAISKTSTNPYVCFGDMNRMESQFKRGGGTTCFQTPPVWKHMTQWISKVDKCGKLMSLLTVD